MVFVPFCNVGSLRVHYRILGQGPPLVLIMGLSGDLTWWEPLVRELEEDFQILLFDNRGAGLTDKPEEKYTIPMFASDTVGLMAALGIPKAHIFGVSMGGMIAQEIALRYPDHVDRLVLGCTHTGGKGFTLPSIEAVQAMTLTRGKSLEEIARQNMTILFGPRFREENPEFIETLVARYVENPPARKPFTQQFWAAIGHNCYDQIQEIRKPTLILTGDADALVPPENAEVLRERIPESRLVHLRGAGHVFFIEDPKETAKVVTAFLTETASSPRKDIRLGAE
jgi:pimeloyl-ACP methyl ester carboxylesterase